MALKEIRILRIHTYVDSGCFADAMNNVEMGDSPDESTEANITHIYIYMREADILVYTLL